MKKIKVISIFSLAVILLSSISCKRGELVQDAVTHVEPLIFTASIDVTKTTLDLSAGENYGKVYWTAGDEVSINGIIYVATPDESDATKATLNKKNESDPNPQPDSEGNYLACYPASVCVPGVASSSVDDQGDPVYIPDGTWHAEFPKVQYYKTDREGRPDISGVSPMTATSETLSLNFTNMGSLVVLTLKGQAADKVQSINLGGYVLYISKAGVALSSEGTKFYIAIPAEDGFNMHIGVTLEDRRSFSKNASAFNVVRNKIYKITLTPTFSPAEEYVQLWADGPYWSTTNLGASSPEQSGYHFSWGNVTPYRHNGDSWVDAETSNVWTGGFCTTNYDDTQGAYLSGDIPMDATYDAAYALSGGMDRMPSQQELMDLLNCGSNNYTILTWINQAGTSGIQITGKGVYANNKIFIPAGGFGDGDAFSSEGTIGRYWSSNFNSGSTGYANAVRFKHQGKININYNSGEPGYLGLTIRPVKNEEYEPMDPTIDYLCLTATEDVVYVSLKREGGNNFSAPISLEYRKSGDACWSTYKIGKTILLWENEKVYFRGENETFSTYDGDYYHFNIIGEVAASGSVMSLLSKDCTKTEVPQSAFWRLFEDCDLLSAPDLPATTLNMWCYWKMFKGCTSLVSAPDLPATELKPECYREMFEDCTQLSTVTVHFTQWVDSSTLFWLSGVASSGTFTCPATLAEPDARDSGNVPSGWSIVRLP